MSWTRSFQKSELRRMSKHPRKSPSISNTGTGEKALGNREHSLSPTLASKKSNVYEPLSPGRDSPTAKVPQLLSIQQAKLTYFSFRSMTCLRTIH